MKTEKTRIKKMIAPIVVTLLISLYCIGLFVAEVVFADSPAVYRLIGALIIGGAFCVGIYVLKERINEIESGEEDDIGKY